MNTSISSFKVYTIAVLLILVVTVGLPTAALLAASEWLIRTRVIPNDRSMWQMDRMLSGRTGNVVFGDSHTMYGVHGVPGFLNLSQPDTVFGIEAKVLDYFADKQPGQVILQADPYLLRPKLAGFKPNFEAGYQKSPTHLWVLTKLYRNKVKKYWELYLEGNAFENKYTFQPDGAITRSEKWTDLPKDERLGLASRFAAEGAPDPAPEGTEAGRSYSRMLAYLRFRGADVCMVHMPLPPTVRSTLAESPYGPRFRNALLYYQTQANTYGATYVDLSSEINDENLFVNQNHLNVEGALKLAPVLQRACFGS